MRTRIFATVIGSLLLALPTFAQDKTTVTANSTDISDNLDLKAVASIFGDASNLEDFERRLNDPKSQITNLDLNNDNLVDYLRVVESVEGNSHIIVIQAVLEKDVYQDVATVEVQKDSNNKVQVQVVGDVYMYGDNYIYEPIYVHTPVIYTTFWVNYYRPYCSSWYWNYYPSYYHCWNPFPIFRYRNHISVYINFGHTYNYVSYRRCHTAYYAYYGRRCNGYERSHPNYSFSHRNRGYSNRYEMDNHREIKTRVPGSRELNTNQGGPRNNAQPRENNAIASNPRGESNPRGNVNTGSPRNEGQPRTNNPREINTPRDVNSPRGNGSTDSPKIESQPRTYNPRGNSSPKEISSPRGHANIDNPRSESPRIESQPRTSNPRVNAQPRLESPRSNAPRSESPRIQSQPRMESPRGGGSSPRMEAPRGGGSSPRMEAPRGGGSPTRGGHGNSGRGR
ncbi:hypothetical protein [Flavobacterium urocaniciphilum]|uniref:DUF3300 domain-containing protein n=1 Tax=Flavobacterium urocaniciphilum TaxID=1299341 RepID=A0A1H8ZLG4_9FLAO|nr:hypothetical protein [Flavobacterium urocaniciphilum]SEP64578.1 hypothetical protein SAMN05444005_101750 [Flavobacterium urocaniciphilum]